MLHPRFPGGGFVIPPVTCSPNIPPQIVDYLQLTPVEIQRLQAQVSEECSQVQPLVDRLERSRRKLMEMKLNGKAGDKEVQAVAAEQSQIVKRLIVMNSQLETKLYSMLTKEQQRKADDLLRQTLDSEEKYRLLNSESPYHSRTLLRGRLVVISRFGYDSRAELAARYRVRAEVGARVAIRLTGGNTECRSANVSPKPF